MLYYTVHSLESTLPLTPHRRNDTRAGRRLHRSCRAACRCRPPWKPHKVALLSAGGEEEEEGGGGQRRSRGI